MEGSRRRGALYSRGESRADETRSLLFKPGLSSENYALLLSKYLRKDLVSRGSVGQLFMDNHQQLLKQRAALLPTGVPNSLDEALCSIRSSGQTRQVPQRRGHEDQTPMFLNGFGTPHAILVEAQMCVYCRYTTFSSTTADRRRQFDERLLRQPKPIPD
jgi:hypothetical protein